jgi:DNA-binding response OmpR family regulator
MMGTPARATLHQRDLARLSGRSMNVVTQSPNAVLRAASKEAKPRPRVLITDDDASLRVLLTALCTRYGYACDSAKDGADALEKLQRSPYDLLLLDLVMPRLNGFEVIDGLRSLSSKPAVIVVSTHPVPQAMLDSEVVHAVMQKPFDFDSLIEVMAETASAMHASRIAAEDPHKV